MKRIESVNKEIQSKEADRRKVQKARLRQLKLAICFADKVKADSRLREHYEALAEARGFPDVYTAAASIYLDTEPRMRYKLKRIKDN